MTVETDWSEIWLSAADWAEAFEAAEPGTPHNEARDQVWEELLAILIDSTTMTTSSRPSWSADRSARTRTWSTPFTRAWPLIESDRPRRRPLDGARIPADVRTMAEPRTRCRGCSERTPTRGRCPTCRCWMRHAAARRPRGVATSSAARRLPLAAERAQMGRVVDDLIDAHRAAPTSRRGLVTMLRREDMQDTLVDESGVDLGADPDLLAGPFAHVVVDEAQELTDAEWQMLLLRCPSRSFTIVGDRAQARHGFAESWQERLGAGRSRPGRPGLADHQLPDAGGGHVGGRAGHPGRAAGRERADLHPQRRRPGRARVQARTCDAIVDSLARRACRGDRLRHRGPDVPGDRRASGR